MASQVKWTLQSIDDLVFVADFISKDSPYFAQVQNEKFFQRVLILEINAKTVKGFLVIL